MGKFYCCDICGEKVSDESDLYDVRISDKHNMPRRKQRGFRYPETCPVCVKAIKKCIKILAIRDKATP